MYSIQEASRTSQIVLPPLGVALQQLLFLGTPVLSRFVEQDLHELEADLEKKDAKIERVRANIQELQQEVL